MKTKFLCATIALLLLISCGGDDGSDVNSAPGSFTASVSNITATSADVSWTEPSDADGDNITYTVNTTSGFTGSETIALNASNNTAAITGLSAERQYSGEIVASDGNGGSSKAAFSFTTTSAGNAGPGAFTVTVGDLTHNTADISWTAAIDPDGDAVTYTVMVGPNEVTTGESGTSYTLESLASGVDFSGKVVASDGNGGTSEATFNFTSYVIDISKYTGMNGFVSATLVDCSYSEGGSGKCYQIKFSSNPVDDDGPYCPATTADVGGFGNYNGDGLDNGGPTNGDAYGFSVMNAALFEAMENDGYDIIDPAGNIRISDFSSNDNPNFGYCLQPLPDDGLELTFEIPVVPSALGSPDNIETVEYVGLALDGVPMNGAPPTVAGSGAQGEGKIPSLDRCGGHHDPAGYYHWHFAAAHMNATLEANGITSVECTKQTQSATALVGYARDGYPLYSGADMDGTVPTDLDACNGHTAATEEYPDGIYHYHASTDITNVPPCIVGKQSMRSFDKPN